MNEAGSIKHAKHEQLDSAIDNVMSALHNAERLHARITNSTLEDQPCGDKGSVSLNSILDHGSERLNNTTDEIHAVINKIEEALFG